jgi:hypothetical protein
VFLPVGLLFNQLPPDGGCRSFSLPTYLANSLDSSFSPKGKGCVYSELLGHLDTSSTGPVRGGVSGAGCLDRPAATEDLRLFRF